MDEKDLVLIIAPTAKILKLYMLGLADDLVDTIVWSAMQTFRFETTREIYMGVVFGGERDTHKIRGLVPKRVIIVNGPTIPTGVLAPVWAMEHQYNTRVRFARV